MTEFIAYYESRSKCDAIMAADADADADGYVAIALDNPDARERKQFASLSEAEAWASKAVRDELTVFGAASIDEYEEIPKSRRCRYCVCGGWQHVAHHIVEDTGIVGDESIDSVCAD